MSSIINFNLASLTAQNNAARTQSALGTAIARLSSGLRINGAKDDAAGLAIADRMTSQIRGTEQAAHNANDGISLAQTADGGLASIDGSLQRMRELAVQAANATNSPADRAALQLEVAQLAAEVDRVATQTQFNGTYLLDGSFSGKAFQVGAGAGQTIAVAPIGSVRSNALGMYQGVHYENGHGTQVSNAPILFAVQIGNGPLINLGMIPPDSRAQADAITAANIPGLTCTAHDTMVQAGVSAASASAAGTATLTINGFAIAINGVNGGAALTGNRAAAVAAINAQSAATGVIATDTGAGVALRAPDGRNVATTYAAGTFTGSNENDFGLWASGGLITNGQQVLDYHAPDGVSGHLVWTFGVVNAPFSIAPTGTAVGAMDVSTTGGATAALNALDAAIASVAASRATLGAVQNRLASAVDTLHGANANLSASRSRIQDADFAQESANLSRAQVLQQAGTAMVAQANQSPEQVLQLLR